MGATLRRCCQYSVLLVCVGFGACSLSGCGVVVSAPETSEPGVALRGVVHGGQQPLAGAQLYLYSANTTGYGGSGIAASTANASVSLLKASANTQADSSGDYYTTTDANGAFSITGDYSCTPNSQVYLYSKGGNSSAAIGYVGYYNPAATLMAILGQCPASGSFLATIPSLTINEVTTVAAAYAFAGFASDPLHVSSSGTALATTGIANAFANASNLVSLVSGSALATTPAGNGMVPQALLNTLGNILGACVNSASAGSTACSNLMLYAVNSNGVNPTDTATAALYIAQNPADNVGLLWSLAPAYGVFAPTLSVQPNDWTVAIQFNIGAGNEPNDLAVDGSGDVWVVNPAGNNVIEVNSLGAVISGANGYTGGGLFYPWVIAIDQTGNVWVGNYGSPSSAVMTELNANGTAAVGSPFGGGGLTTPTGIGVDGTGNVWVGTSGSNVVELNGAGVVSGTAGYTAGNPLAVAVDGSADVWVSGRNGYFYDVLSPQGTVIGSSTYAYTNSDLDLPKSMVMDSSGTAWIMVQDYGSIFGVTHTGTILGGPSGFGSLYLPTGLAIDGAGSLFTADLFANQLVEFNKSGSGLVQYGVLTGGASSYPFTVATDGSGDLWSINFGNNLITEFIGVSVPVITPICAGLPATPTSDGSSRLGTRP